MLRPNLGKNRKSLTSSLARFIALTLTLTLTWVKIKLQTTFLAAAGLFSLSRDFWDQLRDVNSHEGGPSSPKREIRDQSQ